MLDLCELTLQDALFALILLYCGCSFCVRYCDEFLTNCETQATMKKKKIRVKVGIFQLKAPAPNSASGLTKLDVCCLAISQLNLEVCL